MPTRLRRLRITRSDLVDKGANYDPETGEGAHVLLYKRADDDPALPTVADLRDTPIEKDDYGEGPAMPDDILAAQEAREAWYRIHNAFMRSFESIMHDATPADQPSLLQEAVKQFAGQMRTVAPSVRKLLDAPGHDAMDLIEGVLGGIEKVGRKISASRMGKLKAALAALQAIMQEQEGEEDTMTDDAKKAADAQAAELTKRAETADAHVSDLTTRAETAEAALTTLQTEMETLKRHIEKQDENPEEAVWKSFTPEQRAALAKKEHEDRIEKEDLRKRLNATEEVAKTERERRERGEYQTQVVQKMSHLPVTADDWWETYRYVDQSPEPHRANLLKVLSSSNEVARQSGLFKEIGRSSTGETGATAYEKMTALAKEKVSKGEAKDMSEGIAKVASEQTELYAQYQAERRAR